MLPFDNFSLKNPNFQAYDVAHSRVQLHGPTFFTPVIQHVSRFAEAYQAQGQQYFVLLILTDGEITDLDETKAAICDASMFPMSIIIVGVGRADFSSMVALDSDKGLLRQALFLDVLVNT